MKQGKLLAALLLPLMCTGCGLADATTPTCSDESTLDLVREIIAEHVADDGAALPTTPALRERLAIELPHATKLEENIRKYSCEATLSVSTGSGRHEASLEYESQLDDTGNHLVSVESGLDLLDVIAIKAAVFPPEPAPVPTDAAIVGSAADASPGPTPQEEEPVVQADDDALDAALSLDRTAETFSSEIDAAMTGLIDAGLLPADPAVQMDYSHYYQPLQPMRVAGATVAMVEYQVMEEFIGCCVNSGIAVLLRGGDLSQVDAYARARNCDVRQEGFYVPDEVTALLGGGEDGLMQLSCGESDSYQ